MDIYNWGLAHYAAQEYQKADSVFGLYISKYPNQVYGYYWKARSDALIDTTMALGMAIPYYTKVIELASARPEENKNILIQAYGYLGAYAANVKKDYPNALQQFEQILVLQPGNADAIRFRDILKKWVEAGKKD
jgi:tetratricopeptide (TPR) repeat protein